MEIPVDSSMAGKTVKEYLRQTLGYSSGMVKRLKFMTDGITVNGEFVTVRYVMQDGDILALRCEDREEDTCPYMIPVDLPLKIAYEDGHICAVDKPPAMPAHPSLGHRLDTVANALAFRYSSKPYVFRPVNRLDRDTSGLMLCANTRLAASKLYREMRAGNISKVYCAILKGTPPEKEGAIFTYMNRCPDSIVKRQNCVEGDDGAKPALTVYKTFGEENGLCAVAAIPVTGRTHQLRVHFSGLGCPIIGDTMYGGDDPAISRHALHSSFLSFVHPTSGETVSLYSAPPEDMTSLGSHLAAAMENGVRELSERSVEIKRFYAQEYGLDSLWD